MFGGNSGSGLKFEDIYYLALKSPTYKALKRPPKSWKRVDYATMRPQAERYTKETIFLQVFSLNFSCIITAAVC